MSKLNNTTDDGMQLVVFDLDSEEYGVEISQVREIIKMEEISCIPRTPDYIKGVINLRGQVTTVISLRKKFGLMEKEVDQNTRIIVAEIDGLTLGITVDAVNEVLKMPKKDIEDTPAIISNEATTKYLRGVGKLDDRLLILLDIHRIMNEDELVEIHQIDKSQVPDEEPESREE
ncbi:MAG: chemotaxis protein CheW [ANME-2 cluster archaeon]|nr:chemotaxis protein CheW [ANME-2 cluster archaeon]